MISWRNSFLPGEAWLSVKKCENKKYTVFCWSKSEEDVCHEVESYRMVFSPRTHWPFSFWNDKMFEFIISNVWLFIVRSKRGVSSDVWSVILLFIRLRFTNPPKRDSVSWLTELSELGRAIPFVILTHSCINDAIKDQPQYLSR